MVEKTEEKPTKKEETPKEEERGKEEIPEVTTEAIEKTSNLFTPEGVAMLSLAGLLDLLGIICAILILAFGTGAILKKILDAIGFLIIGLLWPLLRYGTVPEEVIEKGKEKIKEKITKKRGAAKKAAEKTIGNFFRKHGFKFLGELIPLVGDFLPLWIWTVYSELTS